MMDDPLIDVEGRQCIVCGGSHWYHRHLYPAFMRELFPSKPVDD